MYHQRKHNWVQPVKHCLALETDNGVTRHSIETVKTNIRNMETLSYVELIMPYGKEWSDAAVRLIDTYGNYIQLDGLSWGYGGEGPHGLQTVLHMFENVPLRAVFMQEIVGWNFEHAVIDAQNPVIMHCHCNDLIKIPAQ